MKTITDALQELAESDLYPFHMPGHKRNMACGEAEYAYDITEIDGFDNLHDARGIIADAQKRAAMLWGAADSYFLVNGSTCGILAAVSAAVKKKGHILMARNCHKSAYHAVYLRELKPIFLYPVFTKEGIQGQIRPEEVKKQLEENTDIEAVLITSPTYDGVVSDIMEIAHLAHRYQVPLIVDEAHGAHFGFHNFFPESSVTLGADVIVQSLHKTLPAPTQTAILHSCSERISRKKLQLFLDIYETSSPSYLFLMRMEHCIRMLEKEGDGLFARFADQLRDFYQKTEGFRKVRICRPDAYGFDPSKLLIEAAGMSGKQIYDRLRTQDHIQLEMSQGSYALAMSSVMDTQEGFDRLYQALRKLDRESEGHRKQSDDDRINFFVRQAYQRREQGLTIAEATDSEHRLCDLTSANGEVSAVYVSLYPPGIPILLPGECIDENVLEIIRFCRKCSFSVQGITDNDQIEVVIS